MVSKDGGTSPRWRADGKELMFASFPAPRSIMSVSVDTKGVFTAGVPRRLFSIPTGAGMIASTTDFRRFLATLPTDQRAPESFTVMLNWTSAAQRQ